MKKNMNSLPLDTLQIFGENTNITSSGVIGNVVDTKGRGWGKGTIALDVKLAADTGDETYAVVVEWSIDEAFTSPVVDITIPINAGDFGRKFEAVNNQIAGANDAADAMYRYVRLRGVLAGAAPSLTVTAFLSETIIG